MEQELLKYVLQYKNWIVSFIIFLVFILAVKGIGSSYSRQMAKLEKIRKGDLEERKVLLPRWERVSREYESLTGGLFKDSASFRHLFEEKAKTYNIGIKFLRPQETEGEYFNTASISLGVSAAYTNMTSFIRSLEEENVKIVKLSLEGEGESKSGDIVLEGFIRKEKL